MPRASDDEIQVEVTKFRTSRESLDRLQTVKEALQTELRVIADRLGVVDAEINSQQVNVVDSKDALKRLLGRV